MTAEELKQKFVHCAREAIDESYIERIMEDVEHLETLDDIRPLCQLLIGSSKS